ncbi:glutaredoxin [Acanthocystis turfacea Chlorella virus NTS-1]|nr:glutaredoxin [Acanthocystis turfacea Chlorella virus NTS-1]
MFLVFSKDGCKYCPMAIELLTGMKKDFRVIKILNVAELNEALSDRGLADVSHICKALDTGKIHYGRIWKTKNIINKEPYAEHL